MSGRPRLGIAGFMHEVNGFADPVGLADGIDAALHPGGLADTWEAGALVTRLRSLCDLDIVDLPVWEFGASGPLDGDDFRAVVAGIVARLRAEQPLDALVVLGHGAGRTTDDLDPDATLFEALRAEVGPTVPIVVVLDFHANLSDRMCAAIDVVVGYRTNPHVDIAACLEEAAEHAVRLLDGPPTSLVWCHLPLALSQLAQLTEPAEPLFDRVKVPPWISSGVSLRFFARVPRSLISRASARRRLVSASRTTGTKSPWYSRSTAMPRSTATWS